MAGAAPGVISGYVTRVVTVAVRGKSTVGCTLEWPTMPSSGVSPTPPGSTVVSETVQSNSSLVPVLVPDDNLKKFVLY